MPAFNDGRPSCGLHHNKVIWKKGIHNSSNRVALTMIHSYEERAVRFVLLTCCLVMLPYHAEAINRYTSTALSCNEVKATIHREGAAIMRHGSRQVPGMSLYNRYVASRQFCQPDQEVRTAYIPSAGGSCAVSECFDPELEDFRDNR